MELDKGVQAYLRTGVWRGRDVDNPVVMVDGVAWVRHDAIRIGNAGDASGGLLIHFLWKWMPVAWIRCYGPQLPTPKFQIIDVPEGRHRIEPGASTQEA